MKAVEAVCIAIMLALFTAMGGVATVAYVKRQVQAAHLDGITEGAKQQALKRAGWKECLLK
jgi:hypothetical protein